MKEPYQSDQFFSFGSKSLMRNAPGEAPPQIDCMKLPRKLARSKQSNENVIENTVQTPET